MAERVIPKYINPVIDMAFKKIFGYKMVMIDFLNDLIHTKLEKIQIVDLEYIDKEEKGDNQEQRGITFDLRCKTNDNYEFIVEMQNQSQIHFEKRIKYYLSRAIVSQGIKTVKKKGEKEKYIAYDYNTHPVFGVFFLNFKDNKDKKPLCHKAWVDTDAPTGYVSEDPQYWKIQLPYYREIKESDCKTNIDYWSYLIANMETFTDTLPFTKEKPIFNTIGKIAEYLRLTYEEQERYWHEWDQNNTYHNAMEKAKLDGIEETKAKMVRNMKAEGLDINTIAKISGLSIEEIQNIQ